LGQQKTGQQPHNDTLRHLARENANPRGEKGGSDKLNREDPAGSKFSSQENHCSPISLSINNSFAIREEDYVGVTL
jgi:hypothetical protein